MLKKYLSSYFSYVSRHIMAGGHTIQWIEEQSPIHHVKLSDQEIAEDIERACKEAGGYITFSEYQQIDQFGQHGYHSKHGLHGFQKVTRKQVKQLLQLCMEHQIEHIVDFGCGAGTLGAALIVAAKKQTYPLSWSGIEAQESQHPTIRKQFRKLSIEDSILDITAAVKARNQSKRTLLLCSYSLDSIPPELFLGGHMVGIHMKDLELSEILLSQEMMEQKGYHVSGKNITIHGEKYDLSAWQTHTNQRTFIPLPMFLILKQLVAAYHPVAIVIFDEFRTPELSGVIPKGIPYDLHRYGHQHLTMKQIYNESGRNLYYYPLYLDTIMKLIESWGFTTDVDLDPAFQHLGEKHVTNQKINTCGTIVAVKRTTASK